MRSGVGVLLPMGHLPCFSNLPYLEDEPEKRFDLLADSVVQATGGRTLKNGPPCVRLPYRVIRTRGPNSALPRAARQSRARG
jgi:hypothetical protein